MGREQNDFAPPNLDLGQELLDWFAILITSKREPQENVAQDLCCRLQVLPPLESISASTKALERNSGIPEQPPPTRNQIDRSYQQRQNKLTGDMNLCVQEIDMARTSCVQAAAEFVICLAEDGQKRRRLSAKAVKLQQSYKIEQRAHAANMLLTKNETQPTHQGPQRRRQGMQCGPALRSCCPARSCWN